MSARPANLTLWARGGLAALCVLLVASVLVRIHAYREGPVGGAGQWAASGRPVDLGRGVLLPREAVEPFTVVVEPCLSAVSVDFVRASPYETDPSLVGRPHSDDRVFYVYRGWNLGNRFVAISLNVIYFARAAYARLTLQAIPATDDLALKIIVPSGCDASPEQVMSVLRSTRLQSARSPIRD